MPKLQVAQCKRYSSGMVYEKTYCAGLEVFLGMILAGESRTKAGKHGAVGLNTRYLFGSSEQAHKVDVPLRLKK